MNRMAINILNGITIFWFKLSNGQLKNNKINKAIMMMRGKSPRSDVEMTKKLNFVAAILDICRAFLNQF